jgi:hypothetical protein
MLPLAVLERAAVVVPHGAFSGVDEITERHKGNHQQ